MQIRDTYLVECSRSHGAAAGSNSAWNSNLAQSLLLEPGDLINLESAMVQSSIDDGLIELTGDGDNTGSLTAAYYLANDWVFTCPLPLYDSTVRSDYFHSAVPGYDRFNAQRWSPNYGELDFPTVRPSASVTSPTHGIESLKIKSSKNLTPSYERMYLGEDYFEGLYANGVSGSLGSQSFDPVFSLKTSTVDFTVPKGFHSPGGIAQELTDTMHDIDGDCSAARTSWNKSIVKKGSESLKTRYNVTDAVSRAVPTTSGLAQFFPLEFTQKVIDALDPAAYQKKVLYRNLLTTEPGRLTALGHLYNGVVAANGFKSTSAGVEPVKQVYTGFKYAGITDMPTGNFGLQICVNDFLKTRYAAESDETYIDTFPFLEDQVAAGTTIPSFEAAFTQECPRKTLGLLDLQDGDIIWTNLVADGTNFQNIKRAFEQLQYPGSDGTLVADIDLGRADDSRCFSGRSNQLGAVATGETAVRSFNLLNPPVSLDLSNPEVVGTTTTRTYAYRNTPLHYVYPVTEIGSPSTVAVTLKSNVVLKKPGMEHDPLNTNDYYCNTGGPDREWGYRVRCKVAFDEKMLPVKSTTGVGSYRIIDKTAPPVPVRKYACGLTAGVSGMAGGLNGLHLGLPQPGTPSAYTGSSNKFQAFDNAVGAMSLTFNKDPQANTEPSRVQDAGITVEFTSETVVTKLRLFAPFNSNRRVHTFELYAADTLSDLHFDRTQQGYPNAHRLHGPGNVNSFTPSWSTLLASDYDTTKPLSSDTNLNKAFTVTLDAPTAYKCYMLRLVKADNSAGQIDLVELAYEVAGGHVQPGIATQGVMGPNNSQGKSYDHSLVRALGLGCVVGYRQTPVVQGTVGTPETEPDGIRDVPFIGFVYHSQRVQDIPTPGIGEMMGVSRSFSDIKCAKVISSQKETTGGTSAAPVYDAAGTDYVSTVNIGAAGAAFRYSQELNKVTLNELHTQMRTGQPEARNYNDATVFKDVSATGAPDQIQKLHFNHAVVTDGAVPIVGLGEPWGLMSAQSGIGITDVGVNGVTVTQANYETLWQGSLWFRLGFEFEDFKAKYQNPQLIFNSGKYHNSSLSDRQKFLNRVSPLTTNGEVSTDQMVSLTANAFNLPVFLAPGSVRAGNPVSIDQVPDFIVASGNPSMYSYSHLLVYSDIVQNNQCYIGSRLNSVIPAVGYVTKSYVTGNFIYGQESPLVFTVDRPYQLSSVSIDIRLPDGRPANIDPNSSLIFRVVKSRTLLDMTQDQLKKIRSKR